MRWYLIVCCCLFVFFANTLYRFAESALCLVDDDRGQEVYELKLTVDVLPMTTMFMTWWNMVSYETMSNKIKWHFYSIVSYLGFDKMCRRWSLRHIQCRVWHSEFWVQLDVQCALSMMMTKSNALLISDLISHHTEMISSSDHTHIHKPLCGSSSMPSNLA